MTVRDDNAFDFYRLLFAVGVIYAHIRYLYGSPDVLFWSAVGFDNLHVGSIAVWGFFSISGYLVAGSMLHSASISNFLEKRFRRVYPGFWFCLIVVSFGFAPLLYALDERGNIWHFFLNNGLDLYHYFTKNISTVINVGDVAGVAGGSINGPLWTISHEVVAYVGVAVLSGFGLFVRSPIRLGCLLVLATLLHTTYFLQALDPEFRAKIGVVVGDARVIILYSIFLWSVVLRVCENFFQINISGAIISVVFLLLGTFFDFLPAVFTFTFSYLTIFLCQKTPVVRLSEKIGGDISYGLYLYHWPVRLVLQKIGMLEQVSLLIFFIVNIVIALPFAYMSWYLVERRYLKRKDPISAPIFPCAPHKKPIPIDEVV